MIKLNLFYLNPPFISPSNLKWKLLHIYLEKYNDVVYYKAVCKRLLTLGFEIPNYILNSFKVCLLSILYFFNLFKSRIVFFLEIEYKRFIANINNIWSIRGSL